MRPSSRTSRPLAYRNTAAETALYLLAVSGIVLWDVLQLPWTLYRWIMVLHSVGGLVASLVWIVPFWWAHRALIRRSRRPWMRTSGRLLDVVLGALLGSGVWLLLVGNRGQLADAWIAGVHLYAGLLVAPLVLAHAWRWSVVRKLLTALAVLAAPAPVAAAIWSGALIASPDGAVLYSANRDAGTVSRIETAAPDRPVERMLGRMMATVALNPAAGQLATTDSVSGVVWLLDAVTLEPLHRVELGGRPWGVIYDAANDWYWVTLFESAGLVAIRPDGTRALHMTVPETPRGLALLSDGRLLISHMLLGQVTVWDSRDPASGPLQTLHLSTTTDPDPFVPQGLPRGLDEIAVSPDEQEIWLPHLLWSFTHPFQFQSTIFPAISVLAVGDRIVEKTDERKVLFRQINLRDVRNRTHIVSNPQSAVFSEDGSKVYVTFSGSEDLVVFDRARGRSVSSGKRRGRRRGKLSEGGAQAVQIVRHLPGQMPWGLVRLERKLLVQNIQSRTLTRLDTGDGGPFSRVRVEAEAWGRTGTLDRLTPEQRRGSRLFHLGNTQANPRYPVAGDNWMSCSSCHIDGFNFTNRFLMAAHAQDKHENAVTGHARLKTLIASDFVGDYIRIIQDTQGGLGADPRDGAEPVDPDAPPAGVAEDMTALHSWVRLAENLPFVSTWLRLDDSRPQVHREAWISSAACAGCHETLFRQWADSNHRLMAESNPYYRVLEDLAGQTEGEAFRSWCVGCHNPQRLTAGLPFRGNENRMFERGGAGLKAQFSRQPWALDEGTGCLFCHRITRVEDAGGNAAFTVNLKDRPTYVGEQSRFAPARWLGERMINAAPRVHAESYSQPFYKDPVYCKGCHDEFSPGHGARIVTTWDEWARSSFNAPGTDRHRTCIDCHMHADPDRIGDPVPGRSTEGGRLKDNVVTHQFVGANHHLVGLRNPDLERQSLALLKRSAKLELRTEPGKLVVRVRNVGAGHALPTGVADFRQLWLQVTVRDAAGRIVLEHGKPDERGHLPPDTRLFMKVFGDEEGKPVGLRFWRYARLLSDTRIPADGYRDEVFDLPENAGGPLQAEVRLNFRIYPQWVTDTVRKSVPDLPEPPVVTLVQEVMTLETDQ